MRGELEILLESLSGDEIRSTLPFSDDIKTTCEVLLNPYSRTDQREEALRGWLNKFQPCLFGRMAAKNNRIFFSIIDDEWLKKGEKAVKDKIRNDKIKWKHFASDKSFYHSFLLVILSSNIHYSAPNIALKRLANWFEEAISIDRIFDPEGNSVCNEWLYLKKPSTGTYHKFRVNLDFFASPGDGRWWHDHRFPGGLAFTLNSVGHMAKYRELYGSDSEPSSWAAKTAMLTIANAFEHPVHGKATKLLNLKDGAPLKNAKCPFANPSSIPKPLENKDWSVYAGNYHTDHAVRSEFFDGSEGPSSSGMHNLDFSYISNKEDLEDLEIMQGIEISKEDFERDAGEYKDLRRFETEEQLDYDSAQSNHIPDEEASKIALAMSACRKWLQEE